MSMSNEQKVYELLQCLSLQYEKIDHPAVFTCEEAALYDSGSGAVDTKNLFLTNGDRSRYFLVILVADKKLRAKDLGRELGEKGLTFAKPEDMQKLLGLTPGAVSPFALVNDGAQDVVVVMDNDVAHSEKVSFHPCVNTASIQMATADFLIVLRQFPNRLVQLDF